MPAAGIDDRERSKAAGDSLGGIVECTAKGVPAGWGAPVYAKLDAELAAACMGINAVKGVEIGEGFAAGRMKGSENALGMRASGDRRRHFDRQADRPQIAFKPTSSIGIKGRHDPCVAIRGAPVVEANGRFSVGRSQAAAPGAMRLVALEAVEGFQAGLAAPLGLAGS
jgi:chorismate synthase